MLDNITENNIRKVTICDNRMKYAAIANNCSEYLVKHNGNKHWLCGTMIMTEWKHCLHSNPFETWKFPSVESAMESFNDRNFNEEY